MTRRTLAHWSAGTALMLACGVSHAVVSGDLLTNSTATTPWQNCTGSDLIAEDANGFDPSHLEGAGCVYRETTAIAGEQYKMTCGVSSFKYSSITLAFLNDSGTTLATQTTEIYEDTQGGAYSVTLTAPAGATIAAVGVYGLAGSGFQDCTLLLDNPAPTPVDGSIAGSAWFDADGNSLRGNSENLIPSTPVSIYLGDQLVLQDRTGLDGNYYFGGLDLGECYRLQFTSSDPTLTFAASGGDNAINSTGATADICLSETTPNITGIDAGFVAAPPVVPPEDYAICGEIFIAVEDTIELIPNGKITLNNLTSGLTQHVESSNDGSFSFANLPSGEYQLVFTSPAGLEFVAGGTTPAAGAGYTDTTGLTPAFELPADKNTGTDDACTVRNINARLLRTPVALDPTVANNDTASGLIGSTITVDILENDFPCDGVPLQVDLIGHNVPGNVSYDTNTGLVTISDTTASGSFSINYGLRGGCGSYATAEITVTVEDLPPPPPPQGPDTPKICLASIGKLTGLESGVHVDLKLSAGETHAVFASQYNFYDADMNLVYTGNTSQAGVRDWGIFFRKAEHGIEVMNVVYVTAVENGIESNPAICTRQQVTPIALDLDNSGRVETIAGEFAFDTDGDGVEEQLMEWFSPNEGILINRNFSLPISGEYLFGDTGGLYTDGFAKLAKLDADLNGQLSGLELGNLAIWTDQNSNTQVDEGEITSLDSHSIESLSVNHYKHAARATLKSGRTMLMRDVFFAMRPIQQASR